MSDVAVLSRKQDEAHDWPRASLGICMNKKPDLDTFMSIYQNV